jgi:uncharacterized damage-inducible protein DinB
MHPYLAMYDYLTKARERLFDWIRPLTPEQYVREFPYALKTVRATVLEIARAEWSYSRRIRNIPVVFGESPFTAEKMPTFADAEAAWRKQAPETRAILAGITDWDAPVEYRFTPPNAPAVRIRATTGGLAAQIILHEVHHRSQAMSMLKQLGVPAQNLDYSAFMFTRQEEKA